MSLSVIHRGLHCSLFFCLWILKHCINFKKEKCWSIFELRFLKTSWLICQACKIKSDCLSIVTKVCCYYIISVQGKKSFKRMYSSHEKTVLIYGSHLCCYLLLDCLNSYIIPPFLVAIMQSQSCIFIVLHQTYEKF